MRAEVARACTGVKTLTAELALSGRAGRQRLRGRVLAGFAQPDSMRLEGVAPFGAPAFILVSRAKTATLILPHDNRVLRGAGADEILGALAGVQLAPADLFAILTGCVVPMPVAVSGTLHANGLALVRLKGDATLYLQRVGAVWQLRAARRAGWQIEHAEWSGSFPRAVRLRSNGGTAAAVDLTTQIAQLEVNVALGPEAFAVDVPASAVPLTLDELRDTGPLRGTE